MLNSLTTPVAIAGPVLSPSAGVIDLDAALARLGGNVDLYRQLYRMFVVDGAGMIDQLADLLAADRRQEAHRVAHTLKGLGGTMGTTALAAAAAQAEAAMARKASNEDGRTLAIVADEFSMACRSIEQALPAAASDEATIPGGT
jgi:HPt (histidine-containing phosphotransfer) domain-containing protein